MDRVTFRVTPDTHPNTHPILQYLVQSLSQPYFTRKHDYVQSTTTPENWWGHLTGEQAECGTTRDVAGGWTPDLPLAKRALYHYATTAYFFTAIHPIQGMCHFSNTYQNIYIFAFSYILLIISMFWLLWSVKVSIKLVWLQDVK